MIGELIAAAIGTIAFSLLFGVPKKYYLYCGGIGAAGWLVYKLMLTAAGLSVAVSVFIATVFVILLSRFAAVSEKCPATVFMITGIFPLVPGASVYNTAYYFITNDLETSLFWGILGVIFILGEVIPPVISGALIVVIGALAAFNQINIGTLKDLDTTFASLKSKEIGIKIFIPSLIIALVALVLFQESKTQGLSGTINGVAETYWGKNKGRSMEGMLVQITKYGVVLFLVLAVVLNLGIW